MTKFGEFFEKCPAILTKSVSKKAKKTNNNNVLIHHLNIPSFDVLLRLDVSSFCVEDVLPRNLYLYQACAIKCPCL